MAIKIYSFYTVTAMTLNTLRCLAWRGAACVERRTSGSEVEVRGRPCAYYNRLR